MNAGGKFFDLSDFKVFAGTHSCVEIKRFVANPGECIALLGPNGSGKSSLLRAISGQGSLQSEIKISGSILIDGKSPLQASESSRAAMVGYFRDSIETEFPISVRDVLHISRAFGRELGSNADLDSLLVEETGLRPLMSLPVSSLSGGEKQRLLIAMALIQNPKILALDETLSQLDLDHLWKMGALLRRFAKKKNSLILLVTHEWNFASQWADRVLLLHRGQIIDDGKPEAVITQKNLATLYPGWPVSVLASDRPQLSYPEIDPHPPR